MDSPTAALANLGLGPQKDGPSRQDNDSPSSVTATSSELTSGTNSPAGIVVIVDPVSTGACLAFELAKAGHRMCCVWSDMCPDKVKAHTKAGTEVDYVAQIQYDACNVEQTLASIAALGPIRDVMVGCETGVLCADVLAAVLGVRGNGAERSAVRRNKWHQIEAVRSAGLDAPLQQLARAPADVERFLAVCAELPGQFGAVVKPVDGAGSDGVFICASSDEVREAYGRLEGTCNVLGLTNAEVLLQEYLRGDEYVIDTVSRDGVHKCVAIWKYDKRRSNGAPVVYFGMSLLSVDAEPQLAGMVSYVEGVLNSIGIRNGAMHTEVKLEARGPVLIEVNARLHGGEGIWLPIAQACLGYTQVSAYRDAFFNADAYDALPAAPTSLHAQGAWVTLRCGASGTIRGLNSARIERIRNLPSYSDAYLPPSLAPGAHVDMTVDACTVHGCFNLVNADPEQLRRDYDEAQALVEEGIIELE